MSTEELRSIGCGPIGGVISAVIASVIFHWQVKRWSHRVPSKFDHKSKKQLLDEYRVTNRIAKFLGLAGLLVIPFYYHGQSMGKDWRGLGIGVGLALSLPVFYIVAANMHHGRDKVNEAWMAFVMDQKTPPKVLIAFIGLGFALGVACTVSVLMQRL